MYVLQYTVQDAPPTYDDAMKAKANEEHRQSQISQEEPTTSRPLSNVSEDSHASGSIDIEFSAPQETIIEDPEERSSENVEVESRR